MPFASSVLVIFGLMYLKKAQANGASTWTCMILVSWACALTFPALTLLGGSMQPASKLWQPAAIGFLFLAGQYLTFLAVKLGDVSIAAPVQGVKVLIVPTLALVILGEPMPTRIWVAASIAVVGIVCVQIDEANVDRSKIVNSVVFAILAAIAMTLFDLAITEWAPAWGAGYFLPIGFTFAAIMSLAAMPFANRTSEIRKGPIGVPLLVGSMLMAIQAIGMTFTLAKWGEPTRVNIVYSLRGIWGVVLTWTLAKRLQISDAAPSHKIMAIRFLGAVLIGTAVMIAILNTA